MSIHGRLWNWCRKPAKSVSIDFSRSAIPLYIVTLIGLLILTACVAAASLSPILFLKSGSYDETEGWIPKELERISFAGGDIVVRRIQYNPSIKAYISIHIETRISSEDDLSVYVNSRASALDTLLDSLSPDEEIYVTVTFKEPFERMEFVNLWRDYLEDSLEYVIIVKNETSGELGMLVLGTPSHDEPSFMEYFTNPKGFKLVSVVAFQALVRVDVAKTLKHDSRILLVDPRECLTIRGLVNKYSFLGFDVTVEMPPFLHAHLTNLPDFTP